ncbi:response regulator [Paenibacillus harenae]|uniref:response regulator n=1 Tax=Paenibacillus harenae TaxID=306543 RepID=UPI0027902C69|nr:response regulator [Paenibacillus harenae]MDQ0058081.1 two-component system response regulator YesN [Paenibacillus harenae]
MTKIRKVIIADDERLVRVGLMHTVDWERWNMEVVGNAPNGEMAWELYEQLRPDLVITDIVMPRMDGIQLAAKIKAANPEAKILFLSCHSDFAYAQQGMELGASGYLLKTAMDSETVDRYLMKITEEWNRTSTPSVDDTNAMYRTWYTEGRNSEQLNQTIGQHLDRLSAEGVILFGLFGLHEESQQLLLQKLEEYGGTDHACDITPIFHLHAEGAPFVIIAPSSDAERLTPLLLDCSNANKAVIWKKTDRLMSSSDFMEEISRMMKTAELERQYEYRTDAVSAPIMKAVIYIDEHLDEPIVSSQLAESIGLSRSHFSTLFKKELGVSFLEFLHRRRLSKASELLVQTDWRINLIGEKVGMEDNKHFSKWFKGYTGMTPSEFRENKRATKSNK